MGNFAKWIEKHQKLRPGNARKKVDFRSYMVAEGDCTIIVKNNAFAKGYYLQLYESFLGLFSMQKCKNQAD
jgi:hypothetical protein